MNIKHVLVTVVILLTSIFSNHVYATHSMGADLTYTCIGPNRYKLRLSFYRDCSGIAAPSSVVIKIKSVSCGDSLTKTLMPIPGTGQEITPICSSVTSTCNGGSYTGIREWVYEGNVTLPSQCPDWEFSYNLCCRNGAISTIVNPLGEQIYIHSTLNNTISPCNNSPTFMNKPVPFVCVGQQFCFNHGAYDADGDSLSYTLINPLGTSGVPVTYIAPYSAMQPISSVPAMTFNSQTGDFCATPQIIEVTVMAVLVQEFRNGVLIGSVERDMQITVRPCGNMLPQLTGINGTNSFAATICADEPFCFNVFTADPDSSQIISVTWDHSIPSGTLTTAGTPHPTATFCWIPGMADVSLTPHIFTVRVEDDACPFYGSQVFSYSLTVIDVTANAGPDQSVHCGGTAVIAASGTATLGSLTYLWSNGITSASQNAAPGTYTVTVSNGSCSATDAVQVILIPDVTAGFNATSSCANSPVSFNDMSATVTGFIASWNWSFGDGNTSTLQNPIHQYAATGNYTVCLKTSNNLGCLDSICKLVIVNPAPIADFLVNNDCEDQPLSIFNNSTPAGLSSYYWDFGNGTSSLLQSPLLTYLNAGTYLVTLIVNDSMGCIDTLQQQVTAYPLPVADFNVTGAEPCMGGQVFLTDTSAGIINQWSWSFGNGQTSTQQNPSLTYLFPGPFDITLVVTSSKGCVDSITKPILISPVFTANPIPGQNSCPGKSVTLNATGGASYLWSNGVSTAAISVNPLVTTTYIVTVTDSKGCIDTTQATVTVYSLPVLTASPAQSICNGLSATITASGANNYTWLPGGGIGQSINVSPAANTIFTVTGTDGNGCSSSSTINVTVNTLPVVSLTNQIICPSSTVLLNAGNSGSSYLWSNGITSQTVTTAIAGTYSVIVTNSFGCTATGQAIIGASTLFSNVQTLVVCQGTSVLLNAGNNGCNYLWSTGVASQNISVSSTGTYTVTVTDANNCSLSFASTLLINPLPTVNFTSDTGCLNIPVAFNNASSVSSGSISSYQWKFGDGTNSTQQNPSHQYSTAGTYNVCLVVTTNNGCIDSVCKSIVIHTPPTANFSVNNNCQGSALNLTNTSASIGLSSYYWNFGNGTSSTQQLPSLAYSIAGNYTIALVVTDAMGCIDTLQNQVTVYSLPVLTASPAQSICNGLSATITASGANNYTWLPGGGIGQSINVSPAANTIYTVTGTDGNGCSSSSTINVTVNTLPVVSLTNQIICPSSSVLLNAGNSGSNYLWSNGITSQTVTTAIAGTYSVTVTNSFGCTMTGQAIIGSSALTANVQTLAVCQGTSVLLNAGNNGCNYLWSTGVASQNISVNSTGTYTVTVTDANNCSLSFASTLIVNPLPTANFTSGTGCLNIPVSFNNTSSVSSGSISSYQWKFGDGTNSTQQNPSHQYSTAGTYTVCLIATTNNGCIDSVCKSIVIHTPPTSNFSVNNNCQGSALNLTNTSVSTGLSNYYWNFGNGTTSTQQLPSLTYSNAGNYTIALVVTDAMGCIDTTQTVVTIFALPQVTASAPLSICSGQSATLSANGASTYTWNPGGVNSQSINVSPATFTNYIVTGIDTNGCSDTASVNIIVNPLPLISLANSVICPASAITLDAGNSGSTYIWSNGSTNQTFSTAIPGSYSVTVTNSFGCTALGKSIVGISSLLSNSQTLSVCSGVVVALNAANAGCTYSWSTGSIAQGISVSNAGAYTVTVTDVNGCTLSFTSTLLVSPLPTPAFTVTPVCFNDTIVFNNTSSIAYGSLAIYHWDFGDGTNSSDKSPQHLYLSPGAFNVTLRVISDSSCTADITKPVIVNPNPLADFTPPVACAGSQVVFNNTSIINNGSISSYKWNFGDSSAISSLPNPSHFYVTAGTYSASLIAISNFGCYDTLLQQVVIHPNPVANFVFDKLKGCGPLIVHFKDSSHISSGSITTRQWNFGDGNTSSVTNPVHTYNNAGTYTITLTTISAYGCSDTYIISNAITVYPSPVAEFTPSPAEATVLQLIIFENQSMNAISYQWDFGDGSFSKVEHPVHNFSNDGTYTVALVATNQYGCTAEAKHQIEIIPTWTVYIPNAFTPNNDAVNDVFTLVGIGITNYNLKIFNRWGDVIFDADNRGWDGIHMKQGVMSKEDVYIYEVVFTVNIGGTHKRKGHVTLMQ